jgi:hypothetical protein
MVSGIVASLTLRFLPRCLKSSLKSTAPFAGEQDSLGSGDVWIWGLALRLRGTLGLGRLSQSRLVKRRMIPMTTPSGRAKARNHRISGSSSKKSASIPTTKTNPIGPSIEILSILIPGCIAVLSPTSIRPSQMPVKPAVFKAHHHCAPTPPRTPPRSLTDSPRADKID